MNPGTPLLFAALVALAFAPTHQSLSQELDTGGTLSVVTTGGAPYMYKDADGHTVVVGQVANMNNLSAMSGIVLRATFYDQLGAEVVEIVRGTTILDIVPAGGTSPYVITSPNPDIGLVSVDVEAFNSSPTKSAGLEVSMIRIVHQDVVKLVGSVNNAGNTDSTDTIVHLAFYDVFDPPRILHVESIHVGNIPVDTAVEFHFSEVPNPRAVGIAMFAESTIMQSDPIQIGIPQKTMVPTLVTISDISITGPDGDGASRIPVGKASAIGSNLWLETILEGGLQPFVYYVQVKQSGHVPYVEFIGSASGEFAGTSSEGASVQWSPQNPGLYFVETFVWDPRGVPIASKGPVSLVTVVG